MGMICALLDLQYAIAFCVALITISSASSYVHETHRCVALITSQYLSFSHPLSHYERLCSLPPFLQPRKGCAYSSFVTILFIFPSLLLDEFYVAVGRFVEECKHHNASYQPAQFCQMLNIYDSAPRVVKAKAGHDDRVLKIRGRNYA